MGTSSVYWSAPYTGTSQASYCVVDSACFQKISDEAVEGSFFAQMVCIAFTDFVAERLRCREKKIWGGSVMVWGGISYNVNHS